MNSSFENIGDILNRNSAFQNVRRAAKEFNALEEFRNLFPDIKDIIKPLKVEKGILFVKVDNSAWRSELHLKKSIVIKKINKKLKEEIIKNIKFI